MKLYHLSFDLESPLTKMFWPRRPKCTLRGEDKTIPRICFSRSVIGCFNALPEENMEFNSNWDIGEYRSKAILYSIDAADISPNKLLGSQELYERGLVPDAVVNQELWCLEPVSMTGEVIDIQMSIDGRNDVLFCTYERNRDFVYSLIDEFCDNYARDHKAELDNFSLFYIMNCYLHTTHVSFEMIANLEHEFFNLARSENGPDFFDAVDVFTHVRIDGYAHCVDEILYMEKYREDSFFDGFDLLDDIYKPSLSSQIYEAESQRDMSFWDMENQSKQFDPVR